MNRPRIRGTAAETAVVNWLREHGWPYAERRALHGGRDLGDVTGCPGLVIEIKDEAKFAMATAVNEMVAETRNAKAVYGFVVRRRRGKPDPGRGFAVLELQSLAALLVEAGYGASPEVEAAFGKTFGGGGA